MKKIAIILIVILVLFAGAWLVGMLFFSGSPAPSNNQTEPISLPTAQNSTAQVTSNAIGVLNLPSTNGGSIQVNDFLSKAETYPDPVNEGYFSLGYPINQTTASTTQPYAVMYIAATQFFTIELLQEPLGGTRNQAELFLEQYLGLTRSDLCRLNYTLSVSLAVSQSYAGKNLGFSFCPGAIKLP